MRKSLGFTLAEVLITLAIIGVVAAMTIPSVIVNTNQQEFKTGLKKAVSVLNQAITMNMALENVTPADLNSDVYNATKQDNLMGYLANRLNIIKVTTLTGASSNQAFYTSDGMRFEFAANAKSGTQKKNCGDGKSTTLPGETAVQNPCLLLVDVNGDKRPNPGKDASGYSVPAANSTRINDIFNIMITDSAAIPYGVVAQRTMFQND